MRSRVLLLAITAAWLLVALVHPQRAQAVVVDPSGVNVRHTGVTSVFLTFRGLRADQVPEEGVWCGRIDPGTGACLDPIFGRLPRRSDLSRISGAGSNLTDIMTIPSSVSRRAFQDARSSGDGEFFYVRRFSSTAALPDEFVAVSCRLAGGGARSPLAILDVDLRFAVDRPVLFVPRETPPAPLSAALRYNGGGRLRGRWEVVMPGDPQPKEIDLLSEASLPVELRGTQRRYTLVDRFDVFLPPTGRAVLPGPDPKKLPHATDGLYLILLRIEASDDREARSDTGAGVALSGGVAGFPMPVLRYYVGSGENETAIRTLASAEVLQPIAPAAEGVVGSDTHLNFSWLALPEAALYELEIESEDGPVFAALISPAVSSYTAPPWVRRPGAALRWRVVAFQADGRPFAHSAWRALHVAP